MKKCFTLLVLLTALFSTNKLKAQEICMVTADYQEGENYMVMWEQFSDFTGLDSVLIYRQDAISPYTYVGGVKIGPGESTYFKDTSSDTKAYAKYVMYLKDSSGAITGPSGWHQPISIDYQSLGTFTFTPYQKENGSMYYYTAYFDATGLGFYQYLNTNFNYTNNSFVDTGYVSHPDAHYYIESYIQVCDIETKAEINTSRSNIKQQVATADLGLAPVQFDQLNIALFPNPTEGEIKITFPKDIVSAEYQLMDLNGRVILNGIIKGSTPILDLTDLAKGNYLIRLTVNSLSVVKKINR